MRWPEARAGLIAIAIGFGLVDGCPLPPPRVTLAWQRWYAEPLREVRGVVLWPVSWIRPTLRVGQQWAVYQAPGGDQYRMSIEGHADGGPWRILFRSGDPEHDDDDDVLMFTRVRGSWQPTDIIPMQYSQFASWITARELERHPALAAVRVRMEKITIVPGGFTSSGQYAWTFVRDRGAR